MKTGADMDNGEKDNMKNGEENMMESEGNAKKGAENEKKSGKSGRGGWFASMDYFKKMAFVMTALSAVAVLFLAISVISSLAGKEKKTDDAKKDSGVVNVSVKEIGYETFRDELTLNADLKSLNGVVSVASPVAGTLVENTVRLGDRVKKGDLLGVVDASDVGVRYKEAPVYAKADGTVTAVNNSVNQKVTAANVLYTIEPNPDFVLSTSVSEADADTISIGALGVFTTAGNKERRHTARLTYISPSVNAQTRTVAVQLDVDADPANLEGLRSGNYVSLRLVRNEFENVFVVPRDALRTFLDGQIVYTVDSDNVAHRVNVIVGSSNETYSIISSGLNAGDRVVVQGTPKDGDKVQIL